MKKLENKTIFITGGLSGIGRACAIEAAKEGANIVIADINTAETENKMTEIRSQCNRSLFIPCDVSDHMEIKSAIEKTIQIFGSLDIALNNAGIGGEGNWVGDMTTEAWNQVINTNLNGVFYGMKYQLTQMMKQGSGNIINMSSILGKVGFEYSSHYVAAKHAVIGLTQTAALEYAAEGIRINAICPGFIETPLLIKGGIIANSDIMNQIIAKHPMKRLGKSDEITKGFMFLATDDSSFVTGTSLNIDGGYLAQ